MAASKLFGAILLVLLVLPAPKVSAKGSSTLQNRAALGGKMRFESRRFDVQHWQHCSVLKSVDGGTGRNRADFGLTPRAQDTGTAFATSTASVSTVPRLCAVWRSWDWQNLFKPHCEDLCQISLSSLNTNLHSSLNNASGHFLVQPVPNSS